MKKTFTLALIMVLFSFVSKAQLISDIPEKPRKEGYVSTIARKSIDGYGINNPKLTLDIGYIYSVKPNEYDLMADTTLKEKYILLMIIDSKKHTFTMNKNKSTDKKAFFENDFYKVAVIVSSDKQKPDDGDLYLYKNDVVVETCKLLIYK